MLFTIEDRLSDSPFVDRIWRAQIERTGFLNSIAMSGWEMVVSRYQDKMYMTVRGPETRATLLPVTTVGTEFFGIRFKVGTVMPHFPASSLVDEDVNLPDASGKSFWLNGAAWQFPNYENADTFLNRLEREGLLARNPVIETTLRGQLKELSVRTARRHFQRTTGLSQSTIRQIERARYATVLLQEGMSILDVVHDAGYYDQPQLTRALKYYIGQTPTQIIQRSGPGQLSFLYKTEPLR